MKLFLSLSALVTITTAFAPNNVVLKSETALNAAGVSREQFLGTAAGASLAALLSFPNAASAAKYGFIGTGSTNVLNPKEAIVDEDVLRTPAVQKALNQVKGYASIVTQMQEALKKNDQADLGPAIRKYFDFGELRAALNTINTAYDEDTQVGTDRLIRVVLQDITELETANRQKEGIPRSEKRLATMNNKLTKLSLAFNDFLAFAPNVKIAPPPPPPPPAPTPEEGAPAAPEAAAPPATATEST